MKLKSVNKLVREKPNDCKCLQQGGQQKMEVSNCYAIFMPKLSTAVIRIYIHALNICKSALLENISLKKKQV